MCTRLQTIILSVIVLAVAIRPPASATQTAASTNGITAFPPFDLEEATIADLQERMESGRETSRSITAKYLARIDAIDRQGPALRSVIETNPDALAIAERLDAERLARGARGKLHGIPILLKGNIATADRMTTTAGSLALAGVIAPSDAVVVDRLRRAGAVILGKTNLSEWANFRSVRASSGWSAIGGQTKNPYALDRSPSGSSSGSAVAVAANLCTVAIGTETDGSIVSPSSVNGVVGIKPTVGLASRTGIVPISSTQDTPGPIARTVADAAIVLSVLSGSDPADPATLGVRRRPFEGARPVSRALRGARIGVVRRLFGSSTEVAEIVGRAIVDMERQGAIIVDPADIVTIDQIGDSEFDVLLYEFKTELDKYLAWLGPSAPVHSLKNVIDFNEAHERQEMPHFGQEILRWADAKDARSSPAYRAALTRNRHLSRTRGIDDVMARHRLDALVAPTAGPAWLVDYEAGDPRRGPGPSNIASVAGYPHITVPAGYIGGLPVGVSFFGRAWSEPVLLGIASAYEQATKHRHPPTLAATANAR